MRTSRKRKKELAAEREAALAKTQKTTDNTIGKDVQDRLAKMGYKEIDCAKKSIPYDVPGVPLDEWVTAKMYVEAQIAQKALSNKVREHGIFIQPFCL